jgi:hypothetical protein
MLCYLTDNNPHTNYRHKEPWTSLALDNLHGFAIQLACAGGSGAIAKTAVAPLERVKVCSSTACTAGTLLEDACSAL